MYSVYVQFIIHVTCCLIEKDIQGPSVYRFPLDSVRNILSIRLTELLEDLEYLMEAVHRGLQNDRIAATQ